MKENLETKLVLRQDWVEHDEDGVSPGGYSLHKDYNSLMAFIEIEKTRNTCFYALSPVGKPHEFYVTEKMYKETIESINGVWGA